MLDKMRKQKWKYVWAEAVSIGCGFKIVCSVLGE